MLFRSDVVDVALLGEAAAEGEEAATSESGPWAGEAVSASAAAHGDRALGASSPDEAGDEGVLGSSGPAEVRGAEAWGGVPPCTSIGSCMGTSTGGVCAEKHWPGQED